MTSVECDNCKQGFVMRECRVKEADFRNGSFQKAIFSRYEALFLLETLGIVLVD